MKKSRFTDSQISAMHRQTVLHWNTRCYYA